MTFLLGNKKRKEEAKYFKNKQIKKHPPAQPHHGKWGRNNVAIIILCKTMNVCGSLLKIHSLLYAAHYLRMNVRKRKSVWAREWKLPISAVCPCGILLSCLYTHPVVFFPYGPPVCLSYIKAAKIKTAWPQYQQLQHRVYKLTIFLCLKKQNKQKH